MPKKVGAVTAKSKYGIILDGGDEWLNWSKPDYRGEPWEADSVVKGDVVELTVDGSFISTVQRVGKAEDVTPPAQDSPESGNFGPPTDTPSPGSDLWAKDKLRARTDSVSCAVGIYKSCIEAGLKKEFPEVEEVIAYAAALEKWARE